MGQSLLEQSSADCEEVFPLRGPNSPPIKVPTISSPHTESPGRRLKTLPGVGMGVGVLFKLSTWLRCAARTDSVCLQG